MSVSITSSHYSMTNIPLSKEQKDLILYCLEQQYVEFDLSEQRDYEMIITKLGLSNDH